MPAGAVSINMDLAKPIYLNKEQQESIVVLGQIGPEDNIHPADESTVQRQPFAVPFDVVRDTNFPYPNFCKSR